MVKLRKHGGKLVVYEGLEDIPEDAFILTPNSNSIQLILKQLMGMSGGDSFAYKTTPIVVKSSFIGALRKLVKSKKADEAYNNSARIRSRVYTCNILVGEKLKTVYVVDKYDMMEIRDEVFTAVGLKEPITTYMLYGTL